VKLEREGNERRDDVTENKLALVWARDERATKRDRTS